MVKQRATQLIQKHESCELKPYKDTVGVLTIGWGRNLDARGIPQWVADALLEEDVDVAIKDLDRLIPWWKEQDEVRQAALIDMSYNLGYFRLAQFKSGTLEDVRNKRYTEAANRLRASLWAKQVKTRAVRIIRMIETGEWPKDIQWKS